MARLISVISILSFFLITGCKKKEAKQELVEITKSVSGLLPDNYKAKTYNLGLSTLSEYKFFKQPLNKLIPINENVIPYELNSPLFTDYASKKRFIVLPENSTINYEKTKALDFPDGTILIKNFYYKASELPTSSKDKIIETRLLIKNKDSKEWEVLPYVWNESQTEAYLYILGKNVTVQLNNTSVNTSFTYSVPNLNTCKNCHNKEQKIVPIGPNSRQLNRDNMFGDKTLNQLSYLKNKGFLNGLPDLKEVEKVPNYQDKTSGTLNDRARAYLEINCAHCHQKEGAAKTSGLYLTYHEKDLYTLGINKPPVAAGKGSGNLSYDIVKGKPEESIIVYRMKGLELDVMMPEIGKSLIHTEGVALISEYIKALK